MLKKLFYFFIFSLLNTAALSAMPAGAVSFYPKISALSAYASGQMDYFFKEQPYKSASAVAELPFFITPFNNFYADINYYVRADYNNNLSPDDSAEYFYDFQKANINYQNGAFLFKAGRQDYAPQNKNFLIYYGPYWERDNYLPTALDGLRHSGGYKFISYDLIWGREAQKYSLYDKSTVYGGNIMISPVSFLDFDLFYYNRASDWDINDIDLSALGAGIVLKPAAFELSFYAALNSGKQTWHFYSFSDSQDFKGHAFNASLKLKGGDDFAQTRYAFNFYRGSAKDGQNLPFTAIAQNLDMGFVFGGSGLLRNNAFGARLNNNTGPGFETSELMIISLTAGFDLNDIPGLAIEGGIYNISATDKQIARV